MKKIISLIKASMTENMNLFRIKNKKQSKLTKIMLPIFLAIICSISVGYYAQIIIEPLSNVKMEFVGLTIFVFFTSIMTLVEGIYKSGSLLFNCKDDNLLLSLPLKKITVLFLRIFKFYLFELLYNSLFLIPAMFVYTRFVSVGAEFYLASFIAILLLPIIPIVISCIIGGIITAGSAKFKLKNIAQIIITTFFLLIILYISFNIEVMISEIAKNATSINEIITKIYYPAGAYINLIQEFNIVNLLSFIFIHLALFGITIFGLSKVYYKINSKVKAVKTNTSNKEYKIKTRKPMRALIKKELARFISSPVFVINAGFGLVLFIAGCIAIIIKFDGIIEMINKNGLPISKEQIEAYIPVIVFGFICFTTLMTSITCSMISLEGKAFNILKSLPVKPFTIIISKILTAVLIIVPIILVGDVALFIRFNFNILEIILILLSSIILPIVAETIGILANLKYPKMDAQNDTEIVKQSMSSMIAVLTGMISVGLTIFVIYKCVEKNFEVDHIIAGGLGVYTAICVGLLVYLNKRSVKEFNMINV